jgi:hypothetical protein
VLFVETFVARVKDEHGTLRGATVVPSVAAFELEPPKRDLDLLRELAATTGGTVLVAPPTRERPLPRGAGPAREPVALAPVLALLALVLLLVDGARRNS